MKKTLANLFLKVYASQGGIVSRWITGGLAGLVVAGLTKLSGVEPSAETIVTITTIATLAVTTIIADFVTKIQLNYGVAMQETINLVKSNLVDEVPVDGRAGPVTQDAFKDAIASVNVMAADLTKAELKTVKAAVVNVQKVTAKLNP